MKEMAQQCGISPMEISFFRDEPGLLPLYLALRKLIRGAFPDCEASVSKTQISFRAPRPFAWVWLPPRRNIRGRPEKYLILSFASETIIKSPFVAECVMIRKGLYTCHAILSRDEQLGSDAAGCITASFALRNPGMGSFHGRE